MDHFTTKQGTKLPLLKLKGKDYLQVAHRLVFFREEHPNGSITSEPVELGDGYAIFRATISILVGDKSVVLATGLKREDKGHFPDYMEKAETGAIGRALAIAGFGTQFTSVELDEEERVVDSPITPKVAATEAAQETKKVSGFRKPTANAQSASDSNGSGSKPVSKWS